MKPIAMAALVALVVVSHVSAEDKSTSVRMSASGTMAATTFDLGKNPITDDEDLAGDGTLGVFTVHGLRANALTPQIPESPVTCATSLQRMAEPTCSRLDEARQKQPTGGWKGVQSCLAAVSA